MAPSQKFVCKPNSLSMNVKVVSSGARQLLNISLVHGKSEGFTARYKVTQITKETLEDKIKKFCEGIAAFTEEDVQRLMPASNIMAALFAYRHLQEVRNSGGGLVWKK